TSYAGGPQNQSVSYSYNPDGTRSGMSTPAGNFTYGYDDAGRLISLTNPRQESTTWTYYDNNWPKTQQSTSAQGVIVAQTSYTFNDRGFLKSLANRAGDGSALSLFENMVHDALGSRVEMDISLPGAHPSFSGHTSYQYDSWGQLVQESST